MTRLGSGLQQVYEAVPVEAEGPHQRFADRRTRLNEHAARIHRPRPPSGHSIYALEAMLLQHPEVVRSAVRWRGAELARLDAATAGAISQLLREAAGFGRLFTGDDPSPWSGAFPGGRGPASRVGGR